jgi:hypothetical protein
MKDAITPQMRMQQLGYRYPLKRRMRISPQIIRCALDVIAMIAFAALVIAMFIIISAL